MKKLGFRLWSAIILIGLMGQFAWTIENMYLNVFLYNTISSDPGYIAAMVSASAVAATLTTLLMGALSDRIGRRKVFICAGYVVWGAATASFGFITVDNAAKLLPGISAAAGAAVMVILMDCLMTFFGSTANDAAFNALITDRIPDEQRGKAESVLAILPLLSMLIIFGLFDGMTQQGRWQEFFLIFGGLVTAVGVASVFLLPKETPRPHHEPFLRQLVHGFRPSVIAGHKALYLSLAGMCMFSIAVQVFFPYLIIYMQHYLRLENYAIVLGSVLLAASAVSLIFGRFIDRAGKLRFAVPAAAVMFIGLIAMYFARSMEWVIPAGIVMMSGYMLLTSALTAQMRELTPEDQAGHFQGIRMIFSVMVPMIVGPFIGAALIRDGGATYVDLGQVKTVPTPAIFLGAATLLVLLALPLGLLGRELGKRRQEELSRPLGLKTPWGEELDPKAPLQEYPRPQFKRDSYLNLNGVWEYAITDNDDLPKTYDGTIVVPFSPESILSGVGRTLLPHQTLWYRRTFTLPAGFRPSDGRVLLHFGAVDQEAAVFVNDHQVAQHTGGYTAFSADITDVLHSENTLIVRVHDDTDASFHSRGKQKTQRGGIWYTPQSGIWQTVWMEAVPAVHMQSVRIEPLFDESAVRITVSGTPDEQGKVRLERGCYAFRCGETLTIPLPNFRPWSPEDPHLYELQLKLGDDRVLAYFAMRKTEVRRDQSGVMRLFLNNKPYFHNGLLDQGYWPDGLLTPPSDEAIVYDIQTAKDLGYNMLRKHIKVEPMRWYYHCDRLGMLVWQDMMNGGGDYRFLTISAPLVTGIHQKDSQYQNFARADEAGRSEYAAELTEMITQLVNVPSIVLWVPFNEGWGQFDAQKACELILALDSSRPIDHASGWHDQYFGDIQSLHVYFKPYRFRPDKLGRAVVLSEFGGYNLKLEGHTFNSVDFGYKKFADADALWQAYSDLYMQQILPAVSQGLAASVYTQLTDVEDELNGLLTYDRRVIKLPAGKLKDLNRRLMSKCPKA